MQRLKPSKGKLLIAEPSILNDTSFNRSIVLLSEHNDEGAIGFIMNKPSEFVISDMIPEVTSNLQIYIGGPVASENLYFVHKIPHLIADSIEIDDDIFWGGNFNDVQHLLENDVLTKDQLQNELDTTSWKIIENKHQNIFDISHKSFWKNELMKFGGEYQIWANAPENPSLN